MSFLAGLSLLALTTAQACSSQQSSSGSGLDFDAISALACSATSDAQNLDQHAAAIEAFAASRSNRILWLHVVDDARASARTLRFLADNAKAVMRMRRQSLDDPGGMLSDGLTLLRPGETLLRQTQALDANIRLLREDANSDQSLRDAVEALASAVKEAREDAGVAVQQGNLLVERARQIARSLGVDIE